MDEVCTHVFDTEVVVDEKIFSPEFYSIVSDIKPEEQEKSITITENGTVEVVPDDKKILKKVTITTDVIGGDTEEYEGSYEVTPKLEEQSLPTALKVMRNDIKIKEIPITKVSNTSGGNTVIIGS